MTWRQSVIFLHLPHLVFCFASLIFYILALTLAVTLPESDAVQKTKIGVMCNVTRHRKNLPFVGVCLNPLWIFFDEIPWESSQFIGISSTKKKNKPFRCWIIGTARIRLAVSLALVYFHPYANCSRLLLVKLPKRGKVWGHGPIFFFGATSCLPSLPRLFPILYFFEPDCLYSSQKICNTDRSLPVVLVLDSSKHLVNVAAHSLMVTSWILWKITVSDKPTKGAMFPSYE